MVRYKISLWNVFPLQFSYWLRLHIDDVAHLVGANYAHTRVFSVGVGDKVSRHAIHTLGRVGGGASIFVAEEESNADVQRKMAKLVEQSTQKTLSEVFINFINFILFYIYLFIYLLIIY